MSRIITQQLCRHRNAITQESQRYVDYSNSCFNPPYIFKPGKYDPDYKYTIKFGGSSFKMTLDELGEYMTNIYGMLTSDKNHPLMKEDARAYLPGNTQCRKIYMTFTYASLIKFLELRESKAAQAEIRMYAQNIGSWFREYTKNFLRFENTSNNRTVLVFDENPITFLEEKINSTDLEEAYIKSIENIIK